MSALIEPLRELEEMGEQGVLNGADLQVMQARAAHERTLRPLQQMLQELRAKHQ